MKHYAFLSAVFGGLLLTACATPFEVSDVNTIISSPTPTSGTIFSQALFDEYKSYAKHEAVDEYEWSDAAFFARKGLLIAQGQAVGPEQIADWNVPAKSLADVTAARERLMGYLSGSEMTREPALVAREQAKFDCWLEEESEKETYTDCRAKFISTEALLKAPEVSKPAPATDSAPTVYRTFIVYFDFGKSAITPVGKTTLADLAAFEREIQPERIVVSGHTDLVGNVGLNKKLSEKRAHAVITALANLGVTKNVFNVTTYGKTMPAVKTTNKEVLNRRVEIYFEK